MAALELSAREMAAAVGMSYKTFQALGAPFRVEKHQGRTSHLYSLPDVINAILRARATHSSGKTYADGENIDIDKERGLKLRAERQLLDVKNAMLQGEYAPVAVLELALANVINSMVPILEAIPANIKRQHPAIPLAIIRQIEGQITLARNNMADAGLNWEQGFDDA